MTDTTTLDSYFDAAQSWAQDRQDTAARSRRIAWIIAATASTLALVEGLALLALMPLKTVVPATVLVDRNTGYAQVLTGPGERITPDAALVQALCAQYVIAREGFDTATLPEAYRKVALWSGEAARADYLAAMAPGNPAGPLARLPRDARIGVQVLSVSPLGEDRVLVRFVTDRRDGAQQATARDHWVATLRYRLSGQPMALEQRLANPLGFQVTQYHRDQEAAPRDEPAPLSPAPVTQAPVQAAAPAIGPLAPPVAPPVTRSAAPAAPAPPPRDRLRNRRPTGLGDEGA